MVAKFCFGFNTSIFGKQKKYLWKNTGEKEFMYIPSEIISPHCGKGKVSGQIFTNLPLVNVKCMH